MPTVPRRLFFLPLLGTAFIFWTVRPSRADEPAPDARKDDRPAVDHALVAGFERFFAAPDSDAARGGTLLLGELGCTACHGADGDAGRLVQKKQAPILDRVGGRVRTSYLRAFLSDPHGVKPGTTMPDALASLKPEEKAGAVEALVHFLATTGTVSESKPDRKAIDRGKTLYHQVGCVACHGPREDKATPPSTSVPLGDLAAKYSLRGLTAFLDDPHAVRPSGRMPGLLLNRDESVGIASYLLRELRGEQEPNLAYRYYEGRWSNLPDFAMLEPVKTGEAAGFDLGVARRANNYALLFEGFLRIEREGTYTFHLSSDDGSRLLIDGQEVVDNDGIHPPQEKSGRVRLEVGVHKLSAAFFNGGGGAELDIDIEGPGLSRRLVADVASLRADAPPETPEGPSDRPISPDPTLVARGRDLFTGLGCASCHILKQGQERLASRLSAPPLSGLRAGAGCLGEAPGPGSPKYALSPRQRKALEEAVASLSSRPSRKPTAEDEIARTLTANNCYVCHERAGVGGVEGAYESFFATNQKEMGDEGRLPPSLNGVGGKLTEEWMGSLLARGAKDRPYMLTRMPKFGGEGVGHLARAFSEADPILPVDTPAFSIPERRVKSTGRFLVGGEAFSCIKCHIFGGVKAEGIQSIDMTLMTRRLRREWFHRYVIDPQAFRPGTRMPSAWPMGQSTLDQVLDGDARKQVEAVWQYLSDGPRAAVPYGLGRDPIPLVASKEAVLYRNFIEGAGTRAIGVGYPEKVNLAFDANALSLAMIWQGGFMDASRHWMGRGEGFQPPLGDNVVSLPPGPAFASLGDEAGSWPDKSSKEAGHAFRGYRLSKDLRPTFLYDLGPIRVEDHPEALAGPSGSSLRRTLTLSSPGPAADVWFRAATADRIESGPEGWYIINGDWRVRMQSGREPLVRKAGNRAELLLHVPFEDGKAKIVEEFSW
jgi:mono/diheme cytochrome c family protein